MGKETKRGRRGRQRRNEAGFKLLGLGLVFVLLPLFLGKSPLAAAFAGLRWPGVLLMLAGGAMLWLGRSRQDLAPHQSVDPPNVRRQSEPVEPSFVERGTDIPHNENSELSLRAERRRPTAWSAEVFDAIEWRRFEAVVEKLFEQAGFETKSKSHGADEGVDVWLYSRHHAEGPVSLVQCKHWHGKQVGVDKIRELRGVMAAFKVPRGQYATTSTYSEAARDFARKNHINLLDVNALLSLIAKRTPEQQAALLEVALEGDYWRPMCVNCGVKMVERKPRKGGTAFWGCVNYPGCKTTMQNRGA